MSSGSKRIEIILESLLESITLAEEMGVCIAAAAGFGEEDQYKIGLGVHEGVMNAFHYGNKRQREKKIVLVFELLREKLLIRVTDQGAGFRVEDVPDPRKDENLMGDSGRGILLMKAFMDEFEVQAARGGGAEVIMAKRYPSRGDSRTT
jgi:serine/threonine-protein kinase RsbW